MPCSACHRDIKIKARGLCAPCYQRWYKRGTTDYAPKRARHYCQIDACGLPVISNGMCDKHYRRWRRHGHTDQTRPDSWGAITDHPLSHAWKWLKRSRLRHEIAEEWRDDFLQFVADVSPKPSSKHKLFAADDSKPIGPNNFVWKQAITERADDEDEKTYYNRVQKVYRSVRKEAYQEYEFKKKYGITRAEYEKLHKQQGGKCAICGHEERLIIRGRKMAPAVDHCHDRGHIRGLLCSQCNRGIGLFRDNPEFLRKAAEYLEWPKRLL